jgi:hypothetical protein
VFFRPGGSESNLGGRNTQESQVHCFVFSISLRSAKQLRLRSPFVGLHTDVWSITAVKQGFMASNIKTNRPSPAVHALAGVLSGIAATGACYPLDLVKTRLQGT